MNPFRALAKVITVPAHEVHDGVRLIKIARAGEDVLDLLEDAAAHPELYRLPTWWERVLIAAQRLVDLIPLPEQGRQTMQNALSKLGIVAGAVVTVAGTVQALPLPAKYQGWAALVGSFAATIAGLYHPAPNQQQPANRPYAGV